MNENYTILKTAPQADYALLDSGEGEKLERFGNVVVSRPDPQALWKKTLGSDVWSNVSASFAIDAKNWKGGGDIKKDWNITLDNLTFSLELSRFKHTGIFPEQFPNWQWIQDAIKNSGKSEVKILNLFGYTGGATLAGLKAGAHVCHVDGSKTAIERAKENAALSGLAEKPVRWILDDAMAFVKREARRGNTYDAIIMDPPTFGHGPNKEVWKIEEHLSLLLEECKKILSPSPLFLIINGYASGYSSLSYRNAVLSIAPNSGSVEYGELSLEPENGSNTLPAGIYARWKA